MFREEEFLAFWLRLYLSLSVWCYWVLLAMAMALDSMFCQQFSSSLGLPWFTDLSTTALFQLHQEFQKNSRICSCFLHSPRSEYARILNIDVF